MKMTKLSAGLVGAVAMGAAGSASAAGLNLSLLGPALGNNALPGTGIYSYGVPMLGGLALALQNNDGDGHSRVGLTVLAIRVPVDVDALPGLPSGVLQLGVEGPVLGPEGIPGTGTHTYILPGLGEATVTLTNNNGDGHSGVGLGVTPAFPGV